MRPPVFQADVLGVAVAEFPEALPERVEPVATLHEISHDPTLRTTATLRDGRRLTAVQLLWEYFHAAVRYLDERGHSAADDPDTAEVVRLWESVLTRLERDPMECATELDWVAKLKLLESYRARDGLTYPFVSSGDRACRDRSREVLDGRFPTSSKLLDPNGNSESKRSPCPRP